MLIKKCVIINQYASQVSGGMQKNKQNESRSDALTQKLLKLRIITLYTV